MRKRALAVAAGAALALVLAAPGAAQGDELPTELWSEYPLVQEVERSGTPSLGPPSLGPLLPPADPGAEPIAGGGSTPWGVWFVVVVALALLSFAVVTRRALPAMSSARHERQSRTVRLHPAQRPRRTSHSPRSRLLAQYAPADASVPDDMGGDEPRRSVVRRTGILRSRFVVVADAMAGDFEAVASSRGFWTVGRDASRQRKAEDAWDELLNDLRESGWEPDSYRRSDYYTLLRPIEEPAQSSGAPFVEAYNHTPHQHDDHA